MPLPKILSCPWSWVILLTAEKSRFLVCLDKKADLSQTFLQLLVLIWLPIDYSHSTDYDPFAEKACLSINSVNLWISWLFYNTMWMFTLTLSLHLRFAARNTEIWGVSWMPKVSALLSRITTSCHLCCELNYFHLRSGGFRSSSLILETVPEFSNPWWNFLLTSSFIFIPGWTIF